MLPAIRSYCATTQIPHLGNQDELVAALQAQGVQPINVLQNTAPGPGASPSAAELTANITELLLQCRADFLKQAQGEDFEVYLRRLEIAFSHDGMSNNTKIDCLIGHTTPTVAAAAQCLYNKGYHSYDDIADWLKIQFLALWPLEDESWAQFGNWLRCEYIQYLPLSANDLPGQERSITAALIGQLLAITTGGLHAHLYSKATANRTLTWVNCLAYADEYRRMHPNTPHALPAPQNTQQGNRRPKTMASGVQKHYCDHHQWYVLHTTTECSLGQNPRPNTATGNQSPQNLQSCTYHPGRLVAHSTADCQNNPANQTYRSHGDQLPEPGKRQDWAVTAVLCSIPQDIDNSLTIIIGIKDKRVTVLINTGATRSFMATNVAAEVGLTPHPTKAKISAAILHISAAILHISANISHLVSTTFSLGSANYCATFFLLANARYPIILGLNTLKNLPFCVTLDGQRIFSGFQTIKPINKSPQAETSKGITFVNGSPAKQQAVAHLLAKYKDNIFQWSGKHGLFPQHVASILTNGQDPGPPRCIRLSPDKIPAMTEILANYTKAGIIEPAQYPVEDYDDCPLPPSIATFGLPLGATLEWWPPKARAPKPVFSTFVLSLTNAHSEGSVKSWYGAAVAFYEEHPAEKVTHEQRKLLSYPEQSDPLQLRVFAKKCICFLSHWPFLDAYQKFLMFLHRFAFSGEAHPIPIERGRASVDENETLS
ncbi:unnamed protein product [Notodromas monacha]|uniref:UDENN domain-containing protein n=1 Tax=Notodromas monacha TaxID=399045 RepID=A0A7R9BDB0_9CRUS|nr:unnamed protein product [Notodromas monacha]CAG0912548.1 unnamed protein product [Notodromas monacha]